jgi:hypothetical protein
MHHPHLHCLVPGGGIAPDGASWISCRPGFFPPVRVLSRMFRGLFLHYLEKAFAAGHLSFFSAHRHLHEPAAFRHYLAPAHNTEWVVYSKRPFAGPAQVLEYVGRYTHRVAISNNRLVSIGESKVRFRWKARLSRRGSGATTFVRRGAETACGESERQQLARRWDERIRLYRPREPTAWRTSKRWFA